MTHFPEPPFSLNDKEDGDTKILDYLKLSDCSNFQFFSNKTRKEISKLKLDEDKDLFAEQKRIFEIWPLILTDALRELKRNDPREWDDPEDERTGTFFDETSLGVTELHDVLTGFSDFEGMMYGASPDRYRDHVVHSFRVWVIGHGILKSCLGGKLKISDEFDDLIESVEWECMWAIAALCHDIGYPLSHIEKVNKKARDALLKQGFMPKGDLRFEFSEQIQVFNDIMLRLMASKPTKLPEVLQSKVTISTEDSEEEKRLKEKKKRLYVTHLQNKYYLKLLKSFDELEHGVVSSLLLSKSLVYFLESDFCHDDWSPLTKEDARQFLIRREILQAIANHTCQDIYHLKFNTLSFLLYIVDEIQCWGRPTLEKLQHESADIRQGKADVKEFSKTRISVKITTEDEEWNKEHKKGVRAWVGRLRKMLRLAVGTPKYKRDNLYLRFEVQNQKNQHCYLELKGGRLVGPTRVEIKRSHKPKR